MIVLGFVGKVLCELECLGGTRCDSGCVDVFWTSYIRVFGVVFGYFKMAQYVRESFTVPVFFEG